MRTTTLTDFRKNLKADMDKTLEDHDILIINRKGNKDMVMLSLQDYESLKETAYLLSSPANARYLFESMQQAEEGKVIHKSLKDLGIE